MNLYHGSNMEVAHPKILERLRALDFGAGFYLTSSYEQAERWAKVVTKRRRTGSPTINIYELNEEICDKINVLRFQSPDEKWLEFVVANRKEAMKEFDYDLVIGPVANDSTLPVIDDYMDGKYTKQQAVERLLPQKLTDQYAFLTERSLKALSYEGKDVL